MTVLCEQCIHKNKGCDCEYDYHCDLYVEIPEIKNCPFCGKPARLYQAYDGKWIVQCTQCGCGTLFCQSYETPVKIWNERKEDIDNE